METKEPGNDELLSGSVAAKIQDKIDKDKEAETTEPKVRRPKSSNVEDKETEE